MSALRFGDVIAIRGLDGSAALGFVEGDTYTGGAVCNHLVAGVSMPPDTLCCLFEVRCKLQCSALAEFKDALGTHAGIVDVANWRAQFAAGDDARARHSLKRVQKLEHLEAAWKQEQRCHCWDTAAAL